MQLYLISKESDKKMYYLEIWTYELVLETDADFFSNRIRVSNLGTVILYSLLNNRTVGITIRVSKITAFKIWSIILFSIINYQLISCIEGDNFLNASPEPKNEEEKLAKALLEDPRVKEAICSPIVERIMEHCKLGQNDQAHRLI